MLGLDVSNWQPDVDWTRVESDGVKFAWLKASEGSSFVDQMFARHVAGARAVGIRVGAYHFARPGQNSADAEAAHFLRVAQPKRGDLRPVLDLESTELDPAATVGWALRWLALVEQQTGIRPVVYTYPSFWQTQLGRTRAFVGFPLWLANYRSPDLGEPFQATPLLSDWPIAAHQFTSAGAVSGISSRVDLNTAADFTAIATEVAMTLPNWLESIDNVIWMKKWVHAFARWRLIDKADPAKRPPEVPQSISQQVWAVVEGFHKLANEYAEMVAAPIRMKLATTATSLSQTEAALESERTAVAMLRTQLEEKQATHEAEMVAMRAYVATLEANANGAAAQLAEARAQNEAQGVMIDTLRQKMSTAREMLNV